MGEIIKPGLFSRQVAADTRRKEFDFKNEQIIFQNKKVDYVFIGDSITHIWQLDAYFDCGSYFVNRGIGSDFPYYIRKRFEADVLQLHPANVVLLCGINETTELEAQATPEERAEEKVRALGAVLRPVEEMAALCKEQGCVLALCSVMPVFGEDNAILAARKQVILNINEGYKKICAAHGAIYVDYHSAFAEEDGKTMKRGYSDDGCHPNAHGYQIMADVLRDVLSQHGRPWASVQASV